MNKTTKTKPKTNKRKPGRSSKAKAWPPEQNWHTGTPRRLAIYFIGGDMLPHYQIRQLAVIARDLGMDLVLDTDWDDDV